MSVGVVTALTLLLAAPAVHGMLVGATTPFEASLRLLAALVLASAVEAVLRRLVPSPPSPPTTPVAAGVPRQRVAPPEVLPQAMPEDLAERLRAGGEAAR